MVSSDVPSDHEVRAFVSEEFLRIGRYTNPAFVKTSKEIMTEAQQRFGAPAPDLESWIQ
jgi:hypothetical protein